ncbi:MAG: peptide ABC transporter permease, partial [Gammaproteobacteria bacterium SG8_11]
MRLIDTLQYAVSALFRHRIRTVLILLAMSIGVASIIILTSLGKGAQRYVQGEFASLGTNLVIVIPGRTETTGGAPTMFIGETPRDLTLDDAQALTYHYSVRRIAPLVVGQAAISYGG